MSGAWRVFPPYVSRGCPRLNSRTRLQAKAPQALRPVLYASPHAFLSAPVDRRADTSPSPSIPVLLGVPTVTVGFRTRQGQLTALQSFNTLEIPRLCVVFLPLSSPSLPPPSRRSGLTSHARRTRTASGANRTPGLPQRASPRRGNSSPSCTAASARTRPPSVPRRTCALAPVPAPGPGPGPGRTTPPRGPSSGSSSPRRRASRCGSSRPERCTTRSSVRSARCTGGGSGSSSRGGSARCGSGERGLSRRGRSRGAFFSLR